MNSSNETYDVAVIGGGVFGLWIAKAAVETGAKVLLADARTIGSGASGGLLGALMPHIPTGWNPKKQFQFDALTDLPKRIAALETETGFTTGYGQIGRIMPIREERFIEITHEREKGAILNWWQGCHSFSFKRADTSPYEDWVNVDIAQYGVMHDTLAARVSPRRLCAALKGWLESRCTLREGWALDAPSKSGLLSFNNGREKITAGKTILTFGYETFDMLRPERDIGTGIKGQAALFECDVKDQPVIYDDGVYIVPHDNGTVAVGSTSEKIWDHPTEPDLSETGFIEKAKTLCPALTELEPTQRWAGVRPKCHKREPIVGKLPDLGETYIATGGFKVSFGMAHLIADALISEMNDLPTKFHLPESFTVAHHLSNNTK